MSKNNKYEYDITKPPSDDDPSFLEHLSQFNESEDARRENIQHVDVSSLRSMAYAATKWSLHPDQATGYAHYLEAADRKRRDGRAPDVEIDAPMFWQQAQDAFPVLYQKSPTLLKLAITEGNTDKFKRSLTGLLMAIEAVQKGEMSVPDCSEALKERFLAMYSHKRGN